MSKTYDLPMKLHGIPDWHGSAYLEFFQVDPQQGVATEAWLGHVSASPENPERYVSVGTFWEEHPAFSGGTAVRHIANEVLLKAINLSLPAADVQRMADLHARIVTYAEDSAGLIDQEWTSVTIDVNGVPEPGKYIKFGDMIAGFVQASTSATPVAFLARGVEPAEIELATVADAAAYGFDLSQGVSRDQLRPTPMPSPSNDFHPDFDQIFS
ncbi:hypothetical protein [Amycolatopsis japonica]|nr:hypothetical protein [Amycolatopsis japonica]